MADITDSQNMFDLCLVVVQFHSLSPSRFNTKELHLAIPVRFLASHEMLLKNLGYKNVFILKMESIETACKNVFQY